MSSGSSLAGAIQIIRVTDTSDFVDFFCGVDEMDRFIHGNLEQSVLNGFCRLYKVTLNGIVAGLFALSCDSLYLDSTDKEELHEYGTVPISERYEEIFWSKRNYPAIEISYLAIEQSLRRSGIGTLIIDAISERVSSQSIAGCQFLTVEALSRVHLGEKYSAVGFYSKLRFKPCELPNPMKDTLRMFRPL